MSWMEYLSEGKQVGILHHFTGSIELESILKNNTLKYNPNSLVSKELNKPVISFTRSKHGIIDKEKDSKTYSKHITYYGPIRISIDGNKLSNNYKIKPIDYSNVSGVKRSFDNMESIVIAKEIKNIDKYILNISYLGRNKKSLDKYNELKSKHPNIKFY